MIQRFKLYTTIYAVPCFTRDIFVFPGVDCPELIMSFIEIVI